MYRMVPRIPDGSTRMDLIVDTDAANEIDDLYALALALQAQDRFNLLGIVATHFAAKAGRRSIDDSYELIRRMLARADETFGFPVVRGGDPIPYMDEPVESDGARLIVEQARRHTPDDPLWVVALGAASNVASAILMDPAIADSVRYVFHARSEWSWPTHSEQFNVGGDIAAARCLLQSSVPLAWFDTGQQLTCPMRTTEERLAPLGGIPAFLHEYRCREPGYQTDTKGFYDLGDIAWMMHPDVCVMETVDAPTMDWAMRFQHRGNHGQMLRVHSINAQPVWELFFDRMAQWRS